MNEARSARRWITLLAVVSGAVAVTSSARAQWPQWGGPNRNFTVETGSLPDSWPEGGPRRLWHRELGTGYSSIVVDDGMLFTMYRKSKPDRYEYTIALDAATGKKIWRTKSLARVPDEVPDYGKEFTGPNATPLVVGDRLFTVGRNAKLHCYQKTDGTIRWKRDLHKDFGAELQTCGYSCSPIAYGNTIILPLGRAEGDTRENSSLVAFDQTTGDVAWQSQIFSIEHSSPILITLDGEDQLVQCADTALLGVNPADGKLLWQYTYPEPERFQGIFATPVWNGRDVIVFSSREVGCAVKLAKRDGRTSAEMLWSSKKTPMGMATPVLFGDMLVGAKRASMQSPLMAVDINTGERLWVKRVFPGSVAIGGGGKLIALTNNGKLGLATVSREGVTVHAESQVAEQYSFTAPTLVGTILYVRDEKHIMAFDLGQALAEAG